MPLRPGSRSALLAAILLSPTGSPAQQDDLSWIDFDRIAAGEIVFQTEPEGRGTVTIRLAIRIESGWEEIWKLLRSCEISPEYVPHVVACSQVESGADGNSETFRQTVKPAFFLPRFEHVFRMDYSPPERIEVSHVSGPIDRMEGHWRLIPQDDGSILLLQRMTVNPGFPVPRFFVRNTLERDMPLVLGEIRHRAEAAN